MRNGFRRLRLTGTALILTASLGVALGGAPSHSWQVLVATGAALEAMIYAVAATCVVRLRARMADEHRPFRIVAGRALGALGVVVFGLLAVVASVSVGDRFNPAPLAVIAVCGGLSAFYVLRVLPGVRAAEQARRPATRRRPPRPPGAEVPVASGPPTDTGAAQPAP